VEDGPGAAPEVCFCERPKLGHSMSFSRMFLQQQQQQQQLNMPPGVDGARDVPVEARYAFAQALVHVLVHAAKDHSGARLALRRNLEELRRQVRPATLSAAPPGQCGQLQDLLGLYPRRAWGLLGACWGPAGGLLPVRVLVPARQDPFLRHLQ